MWKKEGRSETDRQKKSLFQKDGAAFYQIYKVPICIKWNDMPCAFRSRKRAIFSTDVCCCIAHLLVVFFFFWCFYLVLAFRFARPLGLFGLARLVGFFLGFPCLLFLFFFRGSSLFVAALAAGSPGEATKEELSPSYFYCTLYTLLEIYALFFFPKKKGNFLAKYVWAFFGISCHVSNRSHTFSYT